MSSKRSKVAVGLMAGLIVVSVGCIPQNYGYQQPGPAVVVGPGPIQPTPGPAPAPGPMMGGPGGMQIVGLGVSAGFLAVPDVDTEVGSYLNFQASIWLAQILALEIGIGSARIPVTWASDDITVMPVTFNAVISLPDPMTPMIHWRLAAGFGVAAIDADFDDFDPLPLLTFQAGSEFLLGGMGRVFFVADIMTGDLVDSKMWIKTWDFSSFIGLRVGVELGF